MTALLCVFGFLVDRRVDDSLSVRILLLKGQVRHLERIRPVLAQLTPHPDDWCATASSQMILQVTKAAINPLFVRQSRYRN